MPCYSPLLAWQQGNGEIVFVERMGKDVRRELSLPCGQCIGCRLEKSRQWAMRCMHEASLHKQNSFITLTYDDSHLPNRGMLCYPEFQRFIKRLRKKHDVRYYMCGEYGPLNWRPHYHAIIFGWAFPDRTYWGTSGGGVPVYRSAELERLWDAGGSTVGDCTFESAAYCARYCVQKMTGHGAKEHYARWTDPEFGPVYPYQLVPEFNEMSTKPGLASGFLDKWRSDIYPHDYVVVNGKEMKPPKYYDKLQKKHDPDGFDQLQFERERTGRANWEDNVPERLYAKREVQKARANFLKRTIE